MSAAWSGLLRLIRRRQTDSLSIQQTRRRKRRATSQRRDSYDEENVRNRNAPGYGCPLPNGRDERKIINNGAEG